jgi:hypothetical protein
MTGYFKLWEVLRVAQDLGPRAKWLQLLLVAQLAQRLKPLVRISLSIREWLRLLVRLLVQQLSLLVP